MNEFLVASKIKVIVKYSLALQLLLRVRLVEEVADFSLVNTFRLGPSPTGILGLLLQTERNWLQW